MTANLLNKRAIPECCASCKAFNTSGTGEACFHEVEGASRWNISDRYERAKELRPPSPQIKVERASDLLYRVQLEQLEREAYPRHHWSDTREAYRDMNTRLTSGVGQWSYNPESLTVTHASGYPIGIASLSNPVLLLDMLLQVAEKGWMIRAPEGLSELVALLTAISDELLGQSLQAAFCPFGSPRTVQWPSVQGDEEGK